MTDLGKSADITSVVITGRTDAYPVQSNNLVVYIGNSINLKDNERCPGVYNATATINCALSGRYLGIGWDSVPAGSWSTLALSEVEAYGAYSADPSTEPARVNFLLKANTWASSVGFGGTSYVVDGKKTGQSGTDTIFSSG